MGEHRNLYINQYRFIFYCSWVVFYLIFPAWALPISTEARAYVFFGLLAYFTASLWLMNRWFSAVYIDKPFIVLPIDIIKNIKSNPWLFVISCIAVILHIYPIFRPILIIGDEALHLQGGLLIYDYIDVRWHRFFQITVWVLLAFLLFLIIKTKNRVNLNKLEILSEEKTKNLLKPLPIAFSIIFLITYFLLVKDIHHDLLLIRYPPVSKFLYLFVYSAFGISHVFPRLIQLIFYLLCSIYLYRTINLFYDRETALLGAMIYLFLPVTFSYGHLGEIESGTIFFIIASSFYFLRFLKDRDNRDILLTVYLIGTGYLYKDPVFLVFPVCFLFLCYKYIKQPNLYPLSYIKILLFAPLTVIPWMIIQRLYVWRHYTFQLSNLTSLDRKILPYFSEMALNLSLVIFILLILSVIYVCFVKRSIQTIYFGFLFIIYYFFIISDMGAVSPRFSMSFYPSITIFLSLFISDIMKKIHWRHAFKLSFIVLMTYLVIISLDKHSLGIESKKHQYYPSEDAMKWVKENVKDGEKILLMRIMSANFYRVKFRIDESRIINFWYELSEVATPERLKAFCKNNKITYIMFPYGQAYHLEGERMIIRYLKEDFPNEFMEVERFNMGGNYIFVYRLKDNN
ncbi:MAG: glycosyltransferase family 39 protein [Candidatus Nitrosotenuis sp.]